MIAATSEPASGSVIPRLAIARPASTGRTKRATCSASPAAAMCGTPMPWVNRPAQTPLDPPDEDQLLGDQAGVEVVADPAGGLREAELEQPEVPGALVQRPRQRALVLPALEVRDDLARREVGDELAQRPPLGGRPGVVRGDRFRPKGTFARSIRLKVPFARHGGRAHRATAEAWPANCSRSTRLSSLPVALRGSSSTTSTRRGALKCAMRSRA